MGDEKFGPEKGMRDLAPTSCDLSRTCIVCPERAYLGRQIAQVRAHAHHVDVRLERVLKPQRPVGALRHHSAAH